MYKYETHLHTSPVSACAGADVCECMEYYKSLGYDGIFITNHFLDGNIRVDHSLPYEEKINFYFSDYERALSLSDEYGIKVFCGVELSYKGIDFLIYGLDKQWYLDNPQIMNMCKKEELAYMMASGALVIQAHPYREAGYIEYIRLFPRSVHGIEVINSSCNELQNKMAKIYAENYNLLEFAGSDNHHGKKRNNLAGMCSDEPILNETDFVEKVKNGKMQTFFHIY